jgi:hypothetical protein
MQALKGAFTMIRFAIAIVLSASVAACSPAQTDAAAPLAGEVPALVDGVRHTESRCEYREYAGCFPDGEIRANEELELLASAELGASVVGRIEKGEWVEVIGAELRNSPMRGVVRQITPGEHREFAIGQAVYRINRRGDGCINVGAGEQLGVWCEADQTTGKFVVDWEGRPSDLLRTESYLVHVRQLNGKEGWVDWLGWQDGTMKFACFGWVDRDRFCPPPTREGVRTESNSCAPACHVSGWIKAERPVQLLEGASSNARIVATLDAGESVQISETYLFSVPVRGVVRSASANAAGVVSVGDTIYRVAQLDRYCFYGGMPDYSPIQCAGSEPEGLAVDWETLPPHREAKQGLYLNVRRTNGSYGWLRGVDGFSCISPDSREEDCVPPDADATAEDGDGEP